MGTRDLNEGFTGNRYTYVDALQLIQDHGYGRTKRNDTGWFNVQRSLTEKCRL